MAIGEKAGREVLANACLDIKREDAPKDLRAAMISADNVRER